MLLEQGQNKAHHDVALRQTDIPLSVNFLHLTVFFKYNPNKIFKVKVTTTRSKVKSKSHHDVEHLHPQLMCPLSINFLHFTVSDKQPRQTFMQPNHPDIIGENKIHRASIAKNCKLTLQIFEVKP